MSSKKRKYPKRDDFNEAIKFMTPRAQKWAEELVNSVSALNLGPRGKDIVFMWILELLLSLIPYPNKIITHTLANIISDISGGQVFGFLDWSQREKMN